MAGDAPANKWEQLPLSSYLNCVAHLHTKRGKLNTRSVFLGIRQTLKYQKQMHQKDVKEQKEVKNYSGLWEISSRQQHSKTQIHKSFTDQLLPWFKMWHSDF